MFKKGVLVQSRASEGRAPKGKVVTFNVTRNGERTLEELVEEMAKSGEENYSRFKKHFKILEPKYYP